MFANDSVTNLRLARNKRPNRCQSTSVLPIDELRGHVAAKKRRRSSLTLRGLSAAPEVKPGEKTVHFDLSKNTYRDIRRTGTPAEQEEDARNQWMTAQESEFLKKKLQLQILGIQQGMIVPDEDSFCTRGLEAHLDQNLTEERIQKSHAFIDRILQQQTMLNTMMGHVNPDILGKLSVTLSAPDARHASQLAIQDAKEASLIHNDGKPKATVDEKDSGAPANKSAPLSTSQQLQELLRKKVEEQKLAAAKIRPSPAFMPSTMNNNNNHVSANAFPQRKDSDMISFLRSRSRSSTPQASALAAFGAKAAATVVNTTSATTARTAPALVATPAAGAGA